MPVASLPELGANEILQVCCLLAPFTVLVPPGLQLGLIPPKLRRSQNDGRCSQCGGRGQISHSVCAEPPASSPPSRRSVCSVRVRCVPSRHMATRVIRACLRAAYGTGPQQSPPVGGRSLNNNNLMKLGFQLVGFLQGGRTFVISGPVE